MSVIYDQDEELEQARRNGFQQGSWVGIAFGMICGVIIGAVLANLLKL